MMLKGFKNVQYGLTVPGRKKKQVVARPNALAAFDDDGSEGEHEAVPQQLARQAASKKSDSKVAEMHAAALAEDPSAFDYDGVYDTMVETKCAPVAAARVNRSSKYIENLLEKAQTRQREQDIVYERRQLKERKVEDHLFGDKEKFVTSAYKKRLQEQKLWQAEQDIRDAADQKNAAENRGNMNGFTQLTRNVAFERSKPAAVKLEPTLDLASSDPAPVSPTHHADAAKASQGASKSPAQADKSSTLASNQETNGPLQGHKFPGQAHESKASEDISPSAANSKSAAADEVTAPVPKMSVAKHTTADAAAAARERYLARKRKPRDNPPQDS